MTTALVPKKWSLHQVVLTPKHHCSQSECSDWFPMALSLHWECPYIECPYKDQFIITIILHFLAYIARCVWHRTYLTRQACLECHKADA